MSDVTIPHPPGSFWAKKSFGDLPNWAWGGLIIGALVVISVWSKNAKASKTPGHPATIGGDPIPSNIVPQYTFVDESTINVKTPDVTPVVVPPAGPPVIPPTPVVTPPAPTGPGLLSDPYGGATGGALEGGTFDNYWGTWANDAAGVHAADYSGPPAGEWVVADNGSLSSLEKIASAVYGDTAGTNPQDAKFAILAAPENQSLLTRRAQEGGDIPTNWRGYVLPGDRVWVPGLARTK